ncbi:mesothelin-like isoform X1 [Mustela nigripes]|uniref:mesothelin-like isoform X1 n=2 Tax=Mustela nigripes TaxID=77151 RepID=UPI00281617CC|nr:mesothelin-like isoform X1 [Mustela nigripes]
MPACRGPSGDQVGASHGGLGTMAMRTAQPAWGSWGTSAGGSLLLLLLSLGWAFPSRAQAADLRLGVMTPWLQSTSRVLSWWRPELSVVLSRDRRDTDSKVCPPSRKAHVIDENLVFYEEWELEACVDGALVAAQMDRVNMVPFTYQQLDVFKRKLDEFYPQGYPESLTQNLSYFFLELSPADIRKWNVTSLETVKSLLQVSKGQKRDAQVAALIARYVAGGGKLDQATLDMLATFRPAYLCFLSLEQLRSVQHSVLWAAGPQDLDACHPLQMAVLYPRARTAFQTVSGPEYFSRIKPFLGGASTEDLRALSSQKVNMDVATFQKLQTEAVLPLTIAEVQNLLGPNLVGLKAEQERSPVRDWIVRQQQDDLDSLGLGLHGGLPNGYLVMDLRLREALSGGARLVGPRTVLTAIPTLLLALIPK